MKLAIFAVAIAASITLVNGGCLCETNSLNNLCADDWSRTKYLFRSCKRIEYNIAVPCEKIPHICRVVALIQPVTEVQLPCGLIKCDAILALPGHFYSNNGCCQLLPPKPVETEEEKSPVPLAIGLIIGIILAIIIVVLIVAFRLKLSWTDNVRNRLSNLASFHRTDPLLNKDEPVKFQTASHTECDHKEQNCDEKTSTVIQEELKNEKKMNYIL